VIAFVAASPSIDRLIEVDAVRVGEIHRPRRVVAVPGGKGLNAARAAHALGADVVVVAMLAGHAGAWVAEALRAEGVAVEAVAGPGETRVSLSVAPAGGGPLTEFYEPAPEVAAGDWDALEAAVARVAAHAAWVAVSGSLPPGAPRDAYARLSDLARAAGASVALDARDDGLTAGLRAGPDFVKVNAGEAAAVGIAGAAELLDAAGGGGGGADGRAAAITHGSDGMELALPDGRLLHAEPPVEGAYPVGSGDAALGGFLAARAAGEPWEAALALASGAAAANAEQPGAGRLDGARARALADRVRGVTMEGPRRGVEQPGSSSGS
jgi:1-phosphofructokinase family hexose kinase